MNVNVLFFAHYQDVVGSREQLREIPLGATVREVAEDVVKDYPRLGDLLAHSRVAVNADHAAPDKVLSDGDEVAFMPPMSGG